MKGTYGERGLGAVSRIYAERLHTALHESTIRSRAREKGELWKREENQDLIKCSRLPVVHESARPPSYSEIE